MTRRRGRIILRTFGITAILTVTLFMLGAGLLWLRSPQQVKLRELRGEYLAKAEYQAELERKYARLSEYSDQSHAIGSRGGRLIHIPIAQRPELANRYAELARYHRRLRDKYERAAWHPSEPVGPDPPPPEP